MIFAPLIPLQFDDTSGYQNVADLKQLVKFHLTNLLLTNPGERITMPDYGVGLQKFLFESVGTGVIGAIESRVQDQIAVYLDYLDVRMVQVLDNDDHTISLQIEYSVDSVGIDDVLSVELSLNSGDITTETMGVNY